MLGASFLPARFRSDHPHAVAPVNPGYVNRHIIKVLQSISRKAFTHPIHTIVFVALLASTSYIGLLEGSLLDHSIVASNDVGNPDTNSLVENGRRLKLGKESAWKWQIVNDAFGDVDMVCPVKPPLEELPIKVHLLGSSAHSRHDLGIP